MLAPLRHFTTLFYSLVSEEVWGDTAGNPVSLGIPLKGVDVGGVTSAAVTNTCKDFYVHFIGP